MARWTITYLAHEIGTTYIFVSSNTSKPGHLTVSWSYHRPGREIIYRTVRGKLIRCGYRYIWDTPNLVEQQEEGDTMIHGFLLENLVPDSDIWYYQHEAQPPSEWECQGSLHMLHTLYVGAPGAYLYFASRLKGIFRTTTFSGIPGPPPIWVPDNVGLLSLAISQAALDPFIPEHRRYLIAGPHLYRHFNDVVGAPANAITILTWPEAIALTGSVDGDILWVHPNRRHPGMLHVLWNSQMGDNGFWHLRSLDYGEHWTAHQIIDHFLNYNAGNIMAGFDKGTSEHPEGAVLYAAINYELSAKPYLARSFDQGATWETVNGPDQARGEFRPRLWVDPSNQAVLYMGCHPFFPKLYRSEDHGDTWNRIDQGEAITITLENGAYHAVLRTHYADPNLVRLFTRFLVFTSLDYCESWEGTENLAEPLRTGRFTTDNPNFLYLAKVVSGLSPPAAHGPSVIFVSENEGLSFYPKAGANPHLDDGGGDSIPYNCGGAADDGILIVQ